MRKVFISIIVVAVLAAFISHALALTPKPQKGQKIERFTGRVTSISVAEMTMVIESMKAGMSFEIGGARLKGYNTVNNIRPGDRVTVQYVMSQGKATARVIAKNKSYRGDSPQGIATIMNDRK
jgi:translation initiation factor IF-1